MPRFLDWKHVLAVLCILPFTSCTSDALTERTPALGCSETGAQYRIPIRVEAGEFARENHVVSLDVDFTQQLQDLGVSAAFNRSLLRIVEVDPAGSVVDSEVAFQFDAQDDFDPAQRAVGTLLFMIDGETPAGASRRYTLCFADETGVDFTTPEFQPKVQVEDVGMYEGDEAFKITTPSATYYYHKHGSGFASMLDPDGNDWISYRPQGGARGSYRGIPNIAPAGFHPGPSDDNKPSKIVSEGPLRARILSETRDEAWGVTWDIYPNRATMTLFKKGEEPYWILYEGTPGGKFELTDYWVDSSNRVFDDMEALQGPGNPWHGDLPGPEWVYFGDADLERVLYLVQTPDNESIDEFWHFGDGGMTVFGFGRGPLTGDGTGNRHLTGVPTQLTIGFADGSYPDASRVINGAFQPVEVSAGPAERVP